MQQSIKSIRIVHVDDDPEILANMKSLLAQEPDTDYMAGFTSAEEASEFLKTNQPDLLLIDVEMPGHDGLWLAQQARSQQPDIAFVTAYRGYATQAFDACALDYLLKPMDQNRLHILLQKIRHKRAQQTNTIHEQVEAIYKFLNPDLKPNKIFVETGGKTKVVKLDEVYYLQADRNYTVVIARNGERDVSSKTIKVYEEALVHHPGFLRVSRSYIINKNFIKSMYRNSTGRRMIVVMDNGAVIETSYKSKEELVDHLKR